jgi:putative intracellular protease/amidase
MTRLLMVVTGADHLDLKDRSVRRTGFWAEELAVPHRLFRAAGLAIDIATPGGVAAPVDPTSLAPEMESDGVRAVELAAYLVTLTELEHPLVLEKLTAEQVDAYDAIFLPGGHGPMQDLAHSKHLSAIVRRMHGADKLISAVCHGPAGLLPAVQDDGRWLFQGYRLTAFTNEEEASVGLADKVPFLLETRLRELGAVFQAGKPWKPHVEADRKLVTGQNPASSAPIAREVLARLSVVTAP